MRAVVGLFVVFALVACVSAAPESGVSLAPRESMATRTPHFTSTHTSTATVQPTVAATARSTATAQPTMTATVRPTLTAPPTTTPATATESAVSASPASVALATGELTNEMLRVLNQRRSAERCPELVLEQRLTAAAQSHAAEIARRGEVSHRSADGATLEQRLERVGYPFQRRSETIAVSFDPSASAVVDRWLDEPIDGPHRSSVMNCVYQDVGIGVDWTAQGVIYWVVDFGQPRP